MPNVTFIIRGANAGKDGNWGGYKWTKGRTVIADPALGTIKVLGKFYSAHPDYAGDAENADRGTGLEGQVPEDRGTPEGEADDLEGADDPAAGPEEHEAPSVSGPERTEAPPVTEEEFFAIPTTETVAVAPKPKPALKDAILALDPARPEHWTARGLPSTDELEIITGIPHITRRMVERAAPGHERKLAKLLLKERMS